MKTAIVFLSFAFALAACAPSSKGESSKSEEATANPYYQQFVADEAAVSCRPGTTPGEYVFLKPATNSRLQMYLVLKNDGTFAAEVLGDSEAKWDGHWRVSGNKLLLDEAAIGVAMTETRLGNGQKTAGVGISFPEGDARIPQPLRGKGAMMIKSKATKRCE